MNNASDERDIDLLFEVGTQRHVDRTWVQFGGPPFANNAEHSFRVAWIAALLAAREGANMERVALLAIIHDLSETRTGDSNYLSRQYVKQETQQAMDDAFEGTSAVPVMADAWMEYKTRESLESKIVKDADNLDCDLELAEQAANGNRMHEAVHEVRKAVNERLYTETAKRWQQLIWKQDPHAWHLRSRNRLNAGDWKGPAGEPPKHA